MLTPSNKTCLSVEKGRIILPENELRPFLRQSRDFYLSSELFALIDYIQTLTKSSHYVQQANKLLTVPKEESLLYLKKLRLFRQNVKNAVPRAVKTYKEWLLSEEWKYEEFLEEEEEL